MVKIAVLNKEGKEASSLDLPKEIFGERVNQDVIHQAVVMYQASLRQGNASTKERADRRGGGKKPFKQKGTGRARAGSSRSPLWKGGGITFGPHPRDFSYTLPKKIRRSALQESLKAKLADKTLLCVEDLKDDFSKTKEFALILDNLKINGKVVAVLDGSSDTVRRVSKNIQSFNLVRSQDVNALDLIKNKYVLVSKTALEAILKRLTAQEKVAS